MPRTRAIRGATTVERDEPDEITARVGELLEEVIRRNPVNRDDLISIMVTATTDICSMFPATAIRASGFVDVPLIGAAELEVVGSTPRCIRMMCHVETDADRGSIEHVYLHGAEQLRSDLGAS